MTAHPTRDQLRALADAATEGPWELIGGGEYVTGVNILVAPDDGGVRSVDAEFIAAARTALPQLLDALAAAERRATRAEAQSEARRINADYWKGVARGNAIAADVWKESAEEAQARVKAVEDVLDSPHMDEYGDAVIHEDAIRRALEG